MPGSGKTTIGQHIARHWGWTFFDTDHFIERSEGKRLEEIIGVIGFEGFLQIEAGYGALTMAGLLVGIGTRYGSGCTSGHGVCGLSRLSPRSLVATATFMGAGFLTVFIIRHLSGF